MLKKKGLVSAGIKKAGQYLHGYAKTGMPTKVPG